MKLKTFFDDTGNTQFEIQIGSDTVILCGDEAPIITIASRHTRQQLIIDLTELDLEKAVLKTFIEDSISRAVVLTSDPDSRKWTTIRDRWEAAHARPDISPSFKAVMDLLGLTYDPTTGQIKPVAPDQTPTTQEPPCCDQS